MKTGRSPKPRRQRIPEAALLGGTWRRFGGSGGSNSDRASAHQIVQKRAVPLKDWLKIRIRVGKTLQAGEEVSGQSLGLFGPSHSLAHFGALVVQLRAHIHHLP